MTLSTLRSWRIRKPVIPWRDGGSPVVIDVRAAGVVDGTTVVIGPPVQARELGQALRVRAERLPAQAVEHQQDGAAGARDRLRAARRRVATPRSAGTTPVTLGPE